MVDGKRTNYSWSGKRVLITGHTGFIGTWLSLWLHKLGADIAGYALEPHTEPSLYNLLQIDNIVSSTIGDICDRDKLSETINKYQPDVIFHLAAQAIVGKAQAEPYETWHANTLGTVALLEAASKCKSLEALVLYTTDKVYDNPESGEAFTEQDTIGGFGLYDSSKGAAELAIRAFTHAGISPPATASLRAGNVIGGGDWNESRLVPDCIRAFNTGEAVTLRQPNSIRPWQHVLDLCYATILFAGNLAQSPQQFAGGWNIGPDADGLLSASEIADKLNPKGWVCPQQTETYKEAKLLRLNTDNFSKALDWQPILNINETLDWTAQWYKNHHEHPSSTKELTLQQIDAFETKLASLGCKL